MNLQPISATKVSHADGESMANVYLVNIFLPNHFMIPGVRVTECSDAAGNFGAIIGMDLITMGDFSLTNVNDKTVFSFRIPSVKTIDYTAEAQELINRKYENTPRNAPCPCGSGKKYKLCHGK